MKYFYYLFIFFSLSIFSKAYAQEDYSEPEDFADLNFSSSDDYAYDDFTPTDEENWEDKPENGEEQNSSGLFYAPPKLLGFSMFIQVGGSFIFQNHRYDAYPSKNYTTIYGIVTELGMILDFGKYFYFNTNTGLSSVPDDWVFNLSGGVHVPQLFFYLGAGVEIPYYVFSNMMKNSSHTSNPNNNENPITVTPFLELLVEMPVFRDIISITLMTRYHFSPHLSQFSGILSLQAGLKFNIV